MSIAELGYVILQLKDPDAWATFAEETIGFRRADAEGSDGAVFLRMDEAPFRYMLVRGDEEKLLAAGWGLSSQADFEALSARLEAAGVAVEPGDEAGAARRGVECFATARDPSGNAFEFYHGRAKGAAFSPGLGVSRFITDEMGLGHLVLPAPAFDETHAFYKDNLGFGDSDDLALPPFAEGMPDQRVLFLHADNPRHHSLGLYNFPHPAGVVHIMTEVATLDEVGQCLDRVKKAGFPLMADLGRHSNDNMVSFYFFAPGGICLEIGYDGRQIADWSGFTPTKSTSGDIWGHEYHMPDSA